MQPSNKQTEGDSGKKKIPNMCDKHWEINSQMRQDSKDETIPLSYILHCYLPVHLF